MSHNNHATISTHRLLAIILLFTTAYTHADLTSLAKNDAYPIFSTLNFDDEVLLTADQLRYKNVDWADKKKSRVGISISPFGQSADRGKTLRGQTTPIQPATATFTDTALGDLTGRPGMIALVFGATPEGKEWPTSLQTAALHLFQEFPGSINDEGAIDPAQLFGYFSFPLTYRKRGIRFELAARFYKDFGLRIQAGVSSIRQVVEDRIDTTSLSSFNPSPDTVNKDSVNTYLMSQVDIIAQQIGLNLCNFIQTSSEELRFNFFWRHAYEMNEDAENDWAYFLLIPYAQVSASISPGNILNTNQQFAAVFGNNGHNSYGFTAGVNFDFVETIELGGEIGLTAFSKKSFCDYRVPNSKFQTTFFPFTTAATVKPGHNWHFGARIAAYHFLGNLSTYFEWFVIDHKQDSITLQNPDPAFLPCYLEKTTSFKTKLANVSFNYDISPNIGLGFLVQIPFSQRNSYRSSTLMGGINATF